MKTKTKQNIFWIPLVTLVTSLIFTVFFGCSGSRYLIKNLPAQHQRFITSVNLIISRAEKKAFLDLNTSETRDQFIVEFWQKRDPDPTTEENEYKIEYFERIAQANQMFGKKRGWLTDRGRVYVLLGPPETKRVFPTGYNMGDLPSEVWFYGIYGYPIVFVDRFRSGGYELSPMGARHIATIQNAIQQLKPLPKSKRARKPFDYDIAFKQGNSDRQVILTLSIPFKTILFKEEAGKFLAQLIVKVEITDKKGNRYPDVVKRINLTLTQEELNQGDAVHRQEILLQLGKGRFRFIVTLASPKDNLKVTKKGRYTN